MILPKFIAIRAYLESQGIAFANIEYIQTLFDTILKEQTITAGRGQDILGHKTDTATSVFKLFEHIGIIKKEINQDKEILYSFSDIGSQLLKEEQGSGNYLQPIIPFFLNWLPFKLFLKYLQISPGSTTEDIYQNLGKQVENHTKEYNKLVPLKYVDSKTGVAKPFNSFVIPNSLATIGKLLGLTINKKKDGPYELTPLGKYIVNSIDDLSFNFKRLDNSFNYNELALYDFYTSNPSGIVIISDSESIVKSLTFIDRIKEKLVCKKKLHIEPRKLDFNAILTKNKAYWETASSLFNVSYDSLRVLELNAN
ncbi:MAG: hypothetical protein ACTSYF_02210, partial [Promethearchaeota archaeon]